MRQHLTDDGIPLSERQVIMTEIFGTDGFVNAADDASYDEQFVEYCSNSSSKFVQFFNKRLKTEFKDQGKLTNERRHNF